jgi:hypothetical protein
MLPSTFDDNAAYAVLADTRQGFHFVLASQEMLAQAQPFDPLWVFECGDQRSMIAVGRWLAVRRAQWQEWGSLAEAQGRSALGEHIATLMESEPIGEVMGSIIRFDPDPRSLTVGESVVTRGGVRNEILYRHRFSTTGKRKRFFGWFQKNASSGGPEALINLAVTDGTAALAEQLELIAAGHDGKLPLSRAA